MKLLVFLDVLLFIETMFSEGTVDRVSLMIVLAINVLEAMWTRFVQFGLKS